MSGIIINADDFGLNSSVNKAIVESFNKGLINSTTLMANMPCFEEAVDLARKHGLIDKIGIHLVLTEGSPLTEEIAVISNLFSGVSQFKKSGPLMFFFNKKYQKLIFNEFAMQVEKLQSKNIPITHIDTHHHIHEIFSITKIILKLCKEYTIPSIRILNNLDKSSKLYKRVYRNLINFFITRKHANYTDLFGNRSDFLNILKGNSAFLKEKNIEIMVHPDFDLSGKIIDKTDARDYSLSFDALKIIDYQV